jgi:hypothetical protein
MNIATVQKKKFLYNIYKLFYSTGNKPSDHEIKRLYNQYFSYNTLGEPVIIDFDRIQSTNVVGHHALNEVMINTLLNLEVLYDCVMENNEHIFSVVNALNMKLDNLRAKRKEIESKIDQLLFANANSDGFFYSYLENFANTTFIDLEKTSAFVDIVNNHVTIPKVTSETSNQITTKSMVMSNVKTTLTFNGSIVSGPTVISNFDAVFDGLNDTYWSHVHASDAPGIASITFDIPVNIGFSISKVQGSILSESPCSIFLKAVPISSEKPEVILSKTSKEDYNRFSFLLPNDSYSVIYLTLYKDEPDKVVQSVTAPYLYTFGLRELSIGADYYDERATLVSAPISIPISDNNLLSISSVAIDVKQQTVPGTNLSYYVAVDSDSAVSLYDFNWIPIEPSSSESGAIPNTVSLVGSSNVAEYIDVEDDTVDVDYGLIPLNSISPNANELNPVQLPFSDKIAYRVASLNDATKYLQPYLLSSLDNFRSYWIPSINKVDTSLSNSLQSWAEIINDSTYLDLRKNIFTNYSSSFTSAFSGPCSELIETKLLSVEERTVSHTITKSGSFNLTVYLNGSVIGELPAGQSISKLEWNFIKGINTITFAYDNSSTERVSFDLMVGANLFDYGTVFMDYFSYLDPIEFRNKVDSTLSVFTIDSFYGSKYLLASKEISKRSILKYYSDKSQEVNAVRYRVDFNRYANPLQTPILDAIRIKFKHNDVS